MWGETGLIAQTKPNMPVDNQYSLELPFICMVVNQGSHVLKVGRIFLHCDKQVEMHSAECLEQKSFS